VALLDLLRAFTDEDNHSVWRSIDGCLGKLNTLFADSGFHDKFHSFGKNLHQEMFRKLTWSAQPGEKHTDAMTRALVMDRLVSFNDGNIIEEARAELRANLDGSQAIPADFRGAIFRAVARCGDGREY